MPPAVLEAEEKDLKSEPRAEKVVWRMASRPSEGLLAAGRRRTWTLERRLP